MTNKNNKKTIIILALIIALTLLLAGGAYLYISKYSKTSTSNNSAKTIEEIRPTQAQISQDSKKLPDNTTVTDINKTVTISNISSDKSNIYVGVDLGNIKSGTCVLTATQGSTKTQVSGQVSLVTSYYSCEGMTIPKDQFQTGNITFQVSVNSSGIISNSTEKQYAN